MKIQELLNEDGSPKQIEGFNQLYSALDPSWFLNIWISECGNYAIKDDIQGNLRLVPYTEKAQKQWFLTRSIVEGDLENLLSVYNEEKEKLQ